MSRVARLVVATMVALAAPLGAQTPGLADSGLPFAYYADLTSAAPVIADVTVRSAERIKDAADVPPGLIRFYVTADVGDLIRGAGGVPPRIGYVVDLRPGADGKPPRLKKARLLLFARATSVAGQLQLVSPDGQLAWSADGDALARRIAAGLVAADAPPRVTGIGRAFHVPGSLPGEGETQIFLQTANGRPVSLSVIRRPGEDPRWAVALSEIVDEAAAPPPRGTLLWYRLACFLPPALPAESTQGQSDADAAAAAEDYRFVLGALGRCGARPRLSGGGAPA
jgi:hypothetical protein